jgi:type IV pilus assembly protein PilA
MSSELKAKWLQYLSSNKNQGFSILEFLVVIVIIGVLAAIALPSLLSCGNKAQQSEARTYVGSMNRGQQAYFMEKDTFANSIEKLGLGIKTQTANYQYSLQTTPKTAFSYGVALKHTTKPIKSYVGAVFLVLVKKDKTKAAKNKLETVAILCETNTASTTQPANPINQKGVPACATDTYDPTHRQ